MERMNAYYPGRGFPAVSVSGHSCLLGCDHCRGRHLLGMEATTPSTVIDHVPDDAEGVMVSGGCDASGRLDLSGCLPALASLSSRGKRVAVHAVLPDERECRALADHGVEVICLDVHADPQVVRDVLHTDASAEDYRRSLIAARDSGARVFPHVTVGLGEIDWRSSLMMLAEEGVKELAILGLVSTAGTPLEGSEAAEEEMVEAFRKAMDLGLRPTLGCMRPRSHRELEATLLEMGVGDFASPSRSTVRRAEREGVEIHEEHTCCCLSRRWPRSAYDSAWE